MRRFRERTISSTPARFSASAADLAASNVTPASSANSPRDACLWRATARRSLVRVGDPNICKWPSPSADASTGGKRGHWRLAYRLTTQTVSRATALAQLKSLTFSSRITNSARSRDRRRCNANVGSMPSDLARPRRVCGPSRTREKRMRDLATPPNRPGNSWDTFSSAPRRSLRASLPGVEDGRPARTPCGIRLSRAEKHSRHTVVSKNPTGSQYWRRNQEHQPDKFIAQLRRA
jgi:hypothetical protein